MPVATSSPSGDSTAPAAAAAESRDTALVRVVHAVPAGASVDIFADDNRVFESLSYKTVTPYREIDGQRYTFRLRNAGTMDGDPMAINSEGLDDGEYYTVFALPGDRDPAILRVVADDNTAVSPGKARVRVVHAAGNVGEIDIRMAGREDEIFGGVDFQSVSDYDEIDPLAGALEIRSTDEDAGVVASVADARLDAGSSYTIVVVGRGAKPEAFLIRDQPAAATPGTTAPRR